MKRLLFFFMALMPMLYVSAQEIKTKVAYQYGYIECLDKNGNVLMNLTVEELYCLQKQEDKNVFLLQSVMRRRIRV